jgi:hypothetical protein
VQASVTAARKVFRIMRVSAAGEAEAWGCRAASTAAGRSARRAARAVRQHVHNPALKRRTAAPEALI